MGSHTEREEITSLFNAIPATSEPSSKKYLEVPKFCTAID